MSHHYVVPSDGSFPKPKLICKITYELLHEDTLNCQHFQEQSELPLATARECVYMTDLTKDV